MNFSEAAATLVRLGAEYHRRGWMLGTSGNLSAVIGRTPLRLVMTPSSVDKGRIQPDQLLEIGPAGEVLSAAGGQASAETLLHMAIVELTGAEAVLHTHSVWSTVLSDVYYASRGFSIQGYEMLKGLEGVTTHEHTEWLPIMENSQEMAVLAQRADTVIRGNLAVHGFLVRRHGLYTWGKTVEAAARHVEILEFLLEAIGRRQMMEPQPENGGIDGDRSHS